MNVTCPKCGEGEVEFRIETDRDDHRSWKNAIIEKECCSLNHIEITLLTAEAQCQIDEGYCYEETL